MTTIFFIVLAVAYIGVPLFLAVFTSYEAPPSFRASLKEVAQSTLGFWAYCAVSAWVRSDYRPGDIWYILVLTLVASLIRLGIDWLVLRHEAKRTTI